MRKLSWGDIAFVSVGFVFLIAAVKSVAVVILSEDFEAFLKSEFWGGLACPLFAAAFFIFIGFRGRVDIKPEDNSSTDRTNNIRP